MNVNETYIIRHLILESNTLGFEKFLERLLFLPINMLVMFVAETVKGDHTG